MNSSKSLYIQLLTNWFPSREENAAFDLGTVCMTALFERISRQLNTPLGKGFGKLNIEFGPDKRDGMIYGSSTIFTIESTRDIRLFAGLPEQGKRELAVDLMQFGTQQLSAYAGKSIHTFDAVFEQMHRLKMQNFFLWKKKLSRDRLSSCSVFIEYTTTHIILYAAVQRSGEPDDAKPHEVARIKPNEFAIHDMLGDIEFDEVQGPTLIPRSSRSPQIPLLAKSATASPLT